MLAPCATTNHENCLSPILRRLETTPHAARRPVALPRTEVLRRRFAPQPRSPSPRSPTPPPTRSWRAACQRPKRPNINVLGSTRRPWYPGHPDRVRRAAPGETQRSQTPFMMEYIGGRRWAAPAPSKDFSDEVPLQRGPQKVGQGAKGQGEPVRPPALPLLPQAGGGDGVREPRAESPTVPTTPPGHQEPIHDVPKQQRQGSQIKSSGSL